MTRIQLDSRVRLDLRDLPGDVVEELKAAFTYKNPEFGMKQSIGAPTWGVEREIETWRVHESEISVPRGGYRRVRDLLEKHELGPKTIDARHEGSPCPRFPKYVGPEPRYYQLDAKRAAIAKQNCIVRAPTGSGKSFLSIMIASELGLNTLVILPTVALYKQWREDALSALDMRPDELGIIHQGKRVLRPLTVAVQASLASQGIDEELRDFFGVVIVDECFVAGTPILMADGTLKAIEDVREGDEVAVGGRVVATMRRPYAGKLFEVGGAVSTAEHPIATSEGWKTASEVCTEDLLWYDPMHAERASLHGLWRQDAGGHEARAVREASTESRAEAPLEQGARHRRSAGSGLRGEATWEGEAGERGGDRQVLLGSCESSEARSGGVDCAAKAVREAGRASGPARSFAGGDCEGGYASVRGQALRQREAADPVRSGDAKEARSDRVRASARGGFLAETLQGGPRASDGAGGGRDRWEQPHAQAKGARRQEGFLPPVDAVACLPLPGAVRLRRGSARVRAIGVEAATTVFNLETERHVYVAGGVLVHNCQLAAARTYIEAVDPFPAKYRIGISADERRKDRKEFLTRDLFADVAYEIKRRELEEQGFIVDVEIRVVPTSFDAPWYGVVPEAEEEAKESDREGVDFNRLLDAMMADKERDAIAVRFAVDEVEKGNQTILLAHRREHCQQLDREFVERDIRSGFFIGGADYAREFDATTKGIQSGKLRVGVGTYKALGYGVNLPSVAAGVVVTPIGDNKQQFNQVRGRLCRLGKTSARLYVLWDWKVYPGHLSNMIAWNPTVTVYDGKKWVDGRTFKKKHKSMLRRAE